MRMLHKMRSLSLYYSYDTSHSHRIIGCWINPVLYNMVSVLKNNGRSDDRIPKQPIDSYDNNHIARLTSSFNHSNVYTKISTDLYTLF